MNLIKFFLILIVFILFYFLLKHFTNLENYNINFDNNTIPVIEADAEPFRVLPDENDQNDRIEEFESCTLNNEC
tara:strand:- start:18781 stop:19002 length:222 start_codon:yes stop_codon:yes gene_type:complete